MFDAQFAYKIILNHLIESIPDEQIVDYGGDHRLKEIIEQLSDVDAGDTDKL